MNPHKEEGNPTFLHGITSLEFEIQPFTAQTLAPSAALLSRRRRRPLFPTAPLQGPPSTAF
jgi:hypothetical protein